MTKKEFSNAVGNAKPTDQVHTSWGLKRAYKVGAAVYEELIPDIGAPSYRRVH